MPARTNKESAKQKHRDFIDLLEVELHQRYPGEFTCRFGKPEPTRGVPPKMRAGQQGFTT